MTLTAVSWTSVAAVLRPRCGFVWWSPHDWTGLWVREGGAQGCGALLSTFCQGRSLPMWLTTVDVALEPLVGACLSVSPGPRYSDPHPLPHTALLGMKSLSCPHFRGGELGSTSLRKYTGHLQYTGHLRFFCKEDLPALPIYLFIFPTTYFRMDLWVHIFYFVLDSDTALLLWLLERLWLWPLCTLLFRGRWTPWHRPHRCAFLLSATARHPGLGCALRPRTAPGRSSGSPGCVRYGMA